MAISLADIQSAAGRLAGVAHRTPVHTSRTADAVSGAGVHFKFENLQRTGAFKFRGAYNALAQLGPEQRAQGVITYSSGNHAQAIALAGQLLEVPVTVVMPDDAPAIKLAATRGYGANVLTYDRRTERREDIGQRLAAEHGLTLIPPYDHPHIIAGQGTTALELHEQVPGLDVLLVPVGGGGLISGCAVATAGVARGCRVIGVEPAGADDAARSFRTGILHRADNPDTIADGARTPSLGELTFPLVREHVSDIVTVDDTAILAAMGFLWERLKLVVEPTGALAWAALHSRALQLDGAKIGVVISGGNVDLSASLP
jgi:threo-3-hydroxy-L-aspartate ammonia-lyase